MKSIQSLVAAVGLTLLGACHKNSGSNHNAPPQNDTRIYSPQVEIGNSTLFPDRLHYFGARNKVNGSDQILAGSIYMFRHAGSAPPADSFDQITLAPNETVAKWDPCGRIGPWVLTLSGPSVEGTPLLAFEVVATNDHSPDALAFAEFDVFHTKYETWVDKTFELGDNSGHVVGRVYILDRNLDVLDELLYDGTKPAWLLTSQYNDDFGYAMGVEEGGLQRVSTCRPFFVLGPMADVGVYVDGYGGHVNLPISGRVVADPVITDFSTVHVYLDYADQAFSDSTRVNSATGEFKLQPTRTGCARWRVADEDGNNIFVGGFEYWNAPYDGFQIVQQ